MVREPDGDGGGFSVTPGELNETSSVFYNAASDTFELQTSLMSDANQLIAQMSTVLNQSPEALRSFFNRWSTSVENLGTALDSVGLNLYEASTGYEDADTGITNAFHESHGNTKPS